MRPIPRILFTESSRVFAVEQFGIRRWKANEKKDLIRQRQPEKSRNVLWFQRTQIMKKRQAIVFDF